MPRQSVSRAMLTCRLYLRIVLCAAVCIGVAFSAAAQGAQALVGQWQGATEGAEARRVVLMVGSAGGSSGNGVVYLLDDENAAWPHAATAFTVHGADIAFRIANIEVSYEGKVNADGSSMSGVWKQHAASVPLKLVRVSGDAAWEIPSSGKSMPVAADPALKWPRSSLPIRTMEAAGFSPMEGGCM